MTQIAGISTQKDQAGNITHVTIDVRRHPELIAPVLEKLGVLTKSPLQEMLSNDEWHTVEEARQLSIKHIDEVWHK